MVLWVCNWFQNLQCHFGSTTWRNFSVDSVFPIPYTPPFSHNMSFDSAANYCFFVMRLPNCFNFGLNPENMFSVRFGFRLLFGIANIFENYVVFEQQYIHCNRAHAMNSLLK